MMQPTADLFPIPSEILRSLQTPALVVNIDAVRRNLGRLLDCAGGDAGRLRPHLKTTKMPLVWRAMLDAGIRHFKCATTREAAVFAAIVDEASVDDADLLVAYPHREPGLARIGKIATLHSRLSISVACEDVALVAPWPRGVGLFIDINPGMNRTGVPMADVSAIEAIAVAARQRLRGLHFYDGHIRQGGAAARREQAHAGYARFIELAERLRKRGMIAASPCEIVTSGTPTFMHALAFKWPTSGDGWIHRASPGTAVFHDFGYAELLEELEYEYATAVLARVISAPAEGVITTDAGSKSIAAEAGDPVAIVAGHPGLRALRPSEEHLPFEIVAEGAHEGVDGAKPPRRGDVLTLIARHICPTVNLHDVAIIIEDGAIAGLAPIAARGHETSPLSSIIVRSATRAS